MNKGFFIVFEGVDGAGKSTQIQLLKDRIENLGYEVYVTNEPTDRPIGKLIRRILRKEITYSEEILANLYALDRQDHIIHEKEGMLEKVQQGTVVICDRYYWSSLAYHSLYLPMDQVYQMNVKNVSLLQPDITLFLDLEIQQSMKRLKDRGEAAEKFDQFDLQIEIRENFLKAFQEYGEGLEIAKIDASMTIEKIHQSIWDHIYKSLFPCSDT